jgi:hypothetical protein
MLAVALNNWNNSKEKLALLDLSFFDLFIYNLYIFSEYYLKFFAGRKLLRKEIKTGK